MRLLEWRTQSGTSPSTPTRRGNCRPHQVDSVGALPSQHHRERPHSRPHRHRPDPPQRALRCKVLEGAGKQPTGTAKDEHALRDILATKTPLGVPWIEPDDVAPVLVFLASEAGRMASGSTFEIAGGDNAHNTK